LGDRDYHGRFAMTIRSMTGFGQGSAESPQLRVSIELRGVNNRHTDLRFRMPSELADGEAEMRRRILAKVRRGRVEVTINVERPDGSETRQTVNLPLLEEVLGTAQTIAKEFGLKGEPDLMGVLSLPGMFKTETIEIAWSEEQQQLLFQALEAALDAFDADRAREGQALGADLKERIDRMVAGSEQARAVAETVPSTLRDKLLQRLEGISRTAELDPARVAQEAAFLADRSDVTEEIVRLEGHLEQARSLLDGPKGEPLGKRLEFLLQEILRESNTVCSKAADLELTRHALAIKLDVEKAREQVQNLE